MLVLEAGQSRWTLCLSQCIGTRLEQLRDGKWLAVVSLSMLFLAAAVLCCRILRTPTTCTTHVASP
jgi:hypothetical protein